MSELKSPSMGESSLEACGHHEASESQIRSQISVYLMDMWSFIPYYMARLCASLRNESVLVTLGSACYHLDRNYFSSVGLTPDPVLLDSGGGIRYSGLRRVVKSFEYLLNLANLAFRITVSRPDILHVEYLPFLDHGFPFELWFLKWVRFIGVPIVYTVHNVTYQDAPDRHKPMYKRAYHMADALICHGKEAQTQLTVDFNVPPETISVIPHGPLFDEKPTLSQQDARIRLGLPTAETLVLCLGVISEYKGIPFLLDAWKQLVQSGVSARLLVAGTGDARLLSSIRERVSSEELEKSVDLWLHFIPVEQLPLIYLAADILVYPYKAGTTSGALLTGMNYGKPILATKLPFFCEYLKDGENALLFDYGDVDALSSSLRRLILSPKERFRFTRGAENTNLNNHSWDEIARATRECYDNLLKTRGVQSQTTRRESLF
jgi:glycosyltransferase involved in cell wall biosynthesis